MYNLNKIKNKRFTYKTIMDSFNIDSYTDLKEAIDAMIEKNEIIPIKSKGMTSFSPRVYCEYKKAEIKKDYTDLKNEIINVPIIERLDSLKYSLKIIYGKKRNDNEEHLASLNNLISSNNDKISNLTEHLKTGRETISKYAKDEGELNKGIKLFKEYEKNAFRDLEVNFSRNLLEEIDEKEIENKNVGLKSYETRLQSELDSCQKRLEEIRQKNDEIQEDKEEIAALLEKLSNKLNDFNKKYSKFKDEKEICLKILSMYEIPENQIFEN
ncbi:MAG: hypothetical protein WBJ13_02110 [Sedimentibacter sp.]